MRKLTYGDILPGVLNWLARRHGAERGIVVDEALPTIRPIERKPDPMCLLNIKLRHITNGIVIEAFASPTKTDPLAQRSNARAEVYCKDIADAATRLEAIVLDMVGDQGHDLHPIHKPYEPVVPGCSQVLDVKERMAARCQEPNDDPEDCVEVIHKQGSCSTEPLTVVEPNRED